MKLIKSLLTKKDEAKIFEWFMEHSLEKIGEILERNKVISFRAEIDGEIVGYVALEMFYGQPHVNYLIVHKKYRLKGIGTKLMEKAFEFGKENGSSFICVSTFSFQAPNFYQKLGFKVDFVRAGYAKNTSLYYLSKPL
ncbi:MAG: GNAT family N-acetyltransferase [Holosporaceae bacterium]|jgi:ribosomal protein S18 acetylase RimI-like enzyme|nr:GNAT family N-acetyltransferase [Holosporaceae bacterium]